MSRREPGFSASRSGRFVKGQSGNPAGRPKMPKAGLVPSAFGVIFNQRLSTGGPEGWGELTLDQALLAQVYKQALKGKAAAVRKLLRLILARETAIAAACSANPIVRTETIEDSDPANADAALLLLGIVAPDPNPHTNPWRRKSGGEPLLLEPWIAQAALDRRRGKPGPTGEVLWRIKRYTRDAASLRLPQGEP